MQEALENVRRELWAVFAGFCVHVEAAGLIFFGYLMSRDRETVCVICFLVTLVDYPFKSMVCKGLTMSASQISGMALLMNILIIIPMGFAARTTCDELGFDGFVMGCRFAVALPAVNTRLIAPPQILASALAISQRCNPFFAFREVCITAVLIALSCFLESCIMAQIEAQFESAAAESMLSGFRSLLRGVCDGDVLLDSKMEIQGEPQCLKHMLMINSSLHGKSFDQFLNEDEKQRFHKLITSSGKENTESSIPPCVRASLRGANDVKVRVDMFHVQVPQYWGARDMYHLVALREDSEAQVPDATPTELPDFSKKKGPLSRSQRSLQSQSSEGSCHGLPELQEMSLLLDSSVAVWDILQVHLRFRRCPGIASEMPCMRALLRSAEWEKLNGRLKASQLNWF